MTFLFSGQGAQYPGMGQALYRSEANYRGALDRCLALFEAEGIALGDTLFGDDEARLTRTLYAQPALFSVQIALIELWRAWGVTPDTVIGHSVGEFAAAVAAGVCSVEDAGRLVATAPGLWRVCASVARWPRSAPISTRFARCGPTPASGSRSPPKMRPIAPWFRAVARRSQRYSNDAGGAGYRRFRSRPRTHFIRR